MPLESLPQEFGEFADAAVSVIRKAYAINAERYDPEVGDDAVVFGIGVYRNSWFLLEREVLLLDGWKSSRPSGSLVIVGAGQRVHVYRCGQDASVDLHAFRLDDERASATKRLIATTNSDQLTLDLDDSVEPPRIIEPAKIGDLYELVVIHAGNPDDGCCGIWIGAPVQSEETTTSPWAWIEPLWLAEGEEGGGAVAAPEPEPQGTPPHYELPEPEIPLSPVAEDEVVDTEES